MKKVAFMVAGFLMSLPVAGAGEPDWTKPDYIYHVNLDAPRTGTILSLEGPNAQLVYERLPGVASPHDGGWIKRGAGIDCRKDGERYGCSLVILKNGAVKSLSSILGNEFP